MLTDELTLYSASINISEVNNTNQNDPANFNYKQFKGFKYDEIKYFVPSYLVEDYSSYANQEFLNDIQKLENNEITPKDIFDKFGTHAILAVIKGFHFELNISLNCKSITNEEYNFLVAYITDYTVDKYNTEDLDKYNTLSKKCNLELKVNSNYTEDNYFQILNKINTQDYNFTNSIANEGYRPIWTLLSDDHVEVRKLLEEYYRENILNIN